MAKRPTDKELEEIYRKGSEKHNFEYDPEAWDKMTVLLEKKDRRKVILFILFGILFLSIAGLYFGTRNNIVSSNESIVNDAYSTPKIIETEEEYVSADNVTSTNISDQTSNIQTKKTSSKTQKSLGNDVSIKIDNEAKLLGVVEQKQPFTEIASFSAILQSDATSTETSILDIPLTNSGSITSSDNALESSTGSSDYNLLSTIPGLQFSPFATNGYLDLPELEITIPTIASVLKETSLLSVHTILGAESSWTPTGEFSSIDYSIGLGMKVRLRKKLGFSFGATYIRDLYIANRGDYNAGQEFWNRPEEPNYTSADCKMIEINTGLEYHFNGWENNGLGIQLGLLSNFMLSEQYDYHFEEESMNFSSSWTRSNRSLLNAVHISPTYRFTYGHRGSVELGPYFKVPLSGIGHGNILLSSFGLKGSFRIL